MNIERYNRFLWLILLNDKKRRDVIINFISNIPFVFRSKINDLLQKYDEYHMGILDSSSEVIDNDKKLLMVSTFENYLYWASISLETGELFLGVRNNKIDDDFFQMSLVPDTFLEYYNTGNLDSFVIGSVSYNSSFKNNNGVSISLGNDSINYKLMKTPFGFLLEYDSNNDRLKKKKVPVKIKRIPYNLNIYSMSDGMMFNQKS